MKVILYILLAALVLGLAYIRLAPSDPERWHVAPPVSADRTMQEGAIRVAETGPDGLARLHEVALATPRTRVLAGSVEEGMVTYVTRSRVFGFPDYTTARQDGDVLTMHARLRFGRSDLGVNARRLDGWLAALE